MHVKLKCESCSSRQDPFLYTYFFLIVNQILALGFESSFNHIVESWSYLENEILFVSPVNQLINLLVIKISDKKHKLSVNMESKIMPKITID